MPDLPAPAATAARALLASLIRHGLGIAGIALVTRGLVDQSTADGGDHAVCRAVMGSVAGHGLILRGGSA